MNLQKIRKVECKLWITKDHQIFQTEKSQIIISHKED